METSIISFGLSPFVPPEVIPSKLPDNPSLLILNTLRSLPIAFTVFSIPLLTLNIALSESFAIFNPVCAVLSSASSSTTLGAEFTGTTLTVFLAVFKAHLAVFKDASSAAMAVFRAASFALSFAAFASFIFFASCLASSWYLCAFFLL